MNPGDLTERVTIRRATRTEDAGGGQARTWIDVATLSAKVEPISGRERDMARQTEAPRDYRVTLRRGPITAALTADDVVRWRGSDMNIRFIADAGPMPLYVVVDCERGVAV